MSRCVHCEHFDDEHADSVREECLVEGCDCTLFHAMTAREEEEYPG